MMATNSSADPRLIVNAAEFIDNFSDPILLVQGDGCVVAVNRTARRWFGLGRDLQLSRMVEDHDILHLIARGLRSSAPVLERVTFRDFGPLAVTVNRASAAGPGAEPLALLRIDQAKKLAAQFVSLNRRMLEADRKLAEARSERDLLKERARYLDHLARTDALTGLHNARAFREEAVARLNTMLCQGHRAALVYVDVDAFKSINDNYGHDAGDAVLSVLGRELGALCGNGDLAGRLGGDEFVLFLDLERHDDRLTRVIDAIEKSTALPVRWRDALTGQAIDITVSVSMGTASAPSQGETLDLLLQAADRQMYREKALRLPMGRVGDGYSIAMRA